MENFKDKKTDDILEKLVHINRITKVVKGGRRFGFSALVVVGNQAGKIGIAHAKAKQVPDAIKKANEMARRKLTHIPLREGRTIHHDVKAKDGSGRIVLRAASKGTSISCCRPRHATRFGWSWIARRAPNGSAWLLQQQCCEKTASNRGHRISALFRKNQHGASEKPTRRF